MFSNCRHAYIEIFFKYTRVIIKTFKPFFRNYIFQVYRSDILKTNKAIDLKQSGIVENISLYCINQNYNNISTCVTKSIHFICLTKTSTLLILTTKNRMFRFCSRKVVCFHSSPRRIACYALSRRKVVHFGTLLRKIARFAFSREKYHVS